MMAERLWYAVSRGIVNTSAWEWGIHFQSTTTVPADPLQTWTIAHDIFYSDPAGGSFPFLQYMRGGQMVTESSLYEIDPLTDRKKSVSTFPYNLGGTSPTGVNCPPCCSIMALWRPADRLSRIIGRTFLPPFSTAIVSGGDVDTGTTRNIGTHIRKVVGFLKVSGYTVVIRSRGTHTSYPAVLKGVSNQVNYVTSRRPALPPLYSGGDT